MWALEAGFQAARGPGGEGQAPGVLVGLRSGARGMVLAAGLGGRLQLQLQPQLRCLSASGPALALVEESFRRRW